MNARFWFRAPALAIASISCFTLSAMAQTTSTVGYSLSDQAAVATPETEVSQTLAGCDDSGCESNSGCFTNCEPCLDSCCCFGGDFLQREPRRLINTCSPWTVGGWAQAGYVTEGRNNNGDGIWNDIENRVNPQQMWAFIEREANTGGCGTDWGFRMDYMYGVDAFWLQARGGNPGSWDTNFNNGGGNVLGHSIPQLYGTYAVNDLSIKAGHFFAPGAFEFAQAPKNFFYSHSASFVFNRPRTLSGVQGDYKINDYLTGFGGWAAGLNTGFNDNGGDLAYGGFSLAASDTVDIHYVAYFGDFGHDFTGFNGSDVNGFMQNLTIQKEINCKTRYVFQFDHVDNNRYRSLISGFTTPGLGINQSLIRDLNSDVSVGLRYDWYRSNLGTEFKDLTLGINYHPRSNIMIRPEVRWDDFNSVFLRDQVLFGIDAIVQF